MTSRYSIRDLVQATGVPRRTIRYYVQRGLIPAPEGAGRGHFYTEEHRTLLLRARALQAEGYSLDEITALLRGPERDSRDSHESLVAERPTFAQRSQLAAPPDGVEAGSALDRIELVTRVHLAEGVELSFAPPARVPSPARLRAIALAVARLLEH